MRTFRIHTLILAAALAAAGISQTPATAKATVIGVIYPECCEAYESALKSLKAELAKGGYGAGDADLYEQKPSSDIMSWTNAFRKFVGVDADLIIIFGDELLEVACAEKTKVPVLFGFVADPAGAKCVKSIASPGGNVTGVSSRTPIFTLLEKTKKLKDFKTLGVFDLKDDSLAALTRKEIESHSGELGFSVVPVKADNRTEVSEAFAAAGEIDVLFFPNFSVGMDELKELSQEATAAGIPVISLRPTEKGSPSIVSLYPNPEEQGKLMGQMAVSLLKGGSPSKTSVETPKNIELEVNLGLAKQYGLKVPMSVLNSATKVTK